MAVVILQAEELHGSGTIGRPHVERLDLVERIEDWMGDIERDDISSRIHLLDLPDQVLKSLRAAKIIDHHEAAAIEILPEILNVFRVQLQIAGLAQIGEWILEKIGTVDIHDLVRIGDRVDSRHFLQERGKSFIAKREIMMPRDLAIVDIVRRHVVADARVRELHSLWRFVIGRTDPRKNPQRSGSQHRDQNDVPFHKISYDQQLTTVTNRG